LASVAALRLNSSLMVQSVHAPPSGAAPPKELGPYVGSSRIRYREETGPGLEAAPEAFIVLLAGRNSARLSFAFPDPVLILAQSGMTDRGDNHGVFEDTRRELPERKRLLSLQD
jgi:hypothetical protein